MIALFFIGVISLAISKNVKADVPGYNFATAAPCIDNNVTYSYYTICTKGGTTCVGTKCAGLTGPDL